MPRCRAIVRPDGGVSVVHPNVAARRPGESDAQLLARATPPELQGRAFHDLDSDALPPRAEPCTEPGCDQEHPTRDQWRLRGNAIDVDRALPNRHAELAHLARDLDRELAKPSPDLARVADLQRQLRGG